MWMTVVQTWFYRDIFRASLIGDSDVPGMRSYGQRSREGFHLTTAS